MIEKTYICCNFFPKQNIFSCLFSILKFGAFSLVVHEFFCLIIFPRKQARCYLHEGKKSQATAWTLVSKLYKDTFQHIENHRQSNRPSQGHSQANRP
jgi:hypothetical protein